MRMLSPFIEKSPETFELHDTIEPFGKIVPLPIVERLPTNTSFPIITGFKDVYKRQDRIPPI